MSLLMALTATSSLIAQTDTLTLTVVSDTLALSPSELQLTGSEHSVAIECGAMVDCSGLSVYGETSLGTQIRLNFSCDNQGNDATCGTGQISIPQPPGERLTRLRLNLNNMIGEIRLRSATDPPQPTASSQGRLALREQLTLDCRDRISLAHSDTYVKGDSGTVAQFVVTPLGQVLARPQVDQIDEDDFVRVHVVGESELLRKLSVTRASEFRAPNVVTILGEGADPIREDIREQGITGGVQAQCEVQTFLLADFAPGEAVFKIGLREGDKELNLSEVHFGVNHLYDGAFTLGAIWSTLGNPEFGLTSNGDSTVITQTRDPASAKSTDGRGPRAAWAIFYNSFVPSRDIRKTSVRISPAFGAVINDYANILVGASIDYRSNIYVTGGVHLGRVRDLDKRSGLELGSGFKGEASDIPTVDTLGFGMFLGAALDIRAALRLVRFAFSGVSGG
ncbi:hypothetical protein [Candidatus Palauibacter sp.]|uniref:hypothetical protein n=1 Tax=Candidatus Palauibacter sp. TaxID=3101350 RepID=UPI003B02DC5B